MNVIKILAHQKVPNTNDIYKKMCLRFSNTDSFIRSMIYTCAEEAERILMHTTRGGEGAIAQTEHKTILVDIQCRRYRENETFIHGGYTCPNCKRKKISSAHNYCPMCGSHINWIINN